MKEKYDIRLQEKRARSPIAEKKLGYTEAQYRVKDELPCWPPVAKQCSLHGWRRELSSHIPSKNRLNLGGAVIVANV